MTRQGSSGQNRPTPFEGGKVRHEGGRGVWRCCIGGEEGPWADGWTWFGTMADNDAGNVRLVACPAHADALVAMVAEAA